jgi:serine/threonine protein kinase/HAMP domain-containing protein
MEQVGRYEIKELIGEGAMAQVFKAYDPQIGRTLACKILKKERSLDEEYVMRFLREAKAAGSFVHPNIVTVYDVGRYEDRPYIIIELVDGTPLDEVLRDSGKLPMTQALSIGVQLAKALDYAHAEGVVHRDIKPSNILLLPDGHTIKIADFGIAHIDEPDATRHTQAGTVLGTPQYMSPEQVMGTRVDGRSDLFSVGVILYQLFAGRRPFNADTMATLLYQITREEPPPLGEVAPDVPAGLQHIVGKLLSKQPERRFQTGNELAQALERELRSLTEREAEVKRHGFIPISVRWTALLAGVIAVIMAGTIFVVHRVQSDVLTQYAADSGAAFAKFIALESAATVLDQDWYSIEVFVHEASNRESLDYLIVLDHTGVVRGATDASLIGQPFAPPANAELLQDSGGVRTSMVDLPDGSSAFDFQTAITFAGREVGSIRLGLSRAGVQEVERMTQILLLVLAAVTIAAVAVVSFVLGRLLARPINVAREALDAVAEGNFDWRISQLRKDEIGELFESFNKMAANLGAGHHADEGARPSGDALDHFADHADLSDSDLGQGGVANEATRLAQPRGGERR